MTTESQSSRGYVTDVAYLPGYYPYMEPSAIRYVAALQGVSSPPVQAGYRCLELGCGYGETLLTLAAANPNATFTGVDFLPEHADAVRTVVANTGLQNVDMLCCDFADFPSDRGHYDLITLHGVWSWVAPELRSTLLELISRHLANDGLVEVTYNCMPGWASLLPVRSLIQHFADHASGNSLEKVQTALATVTAMRKAGIPLFHDQPLAAELIDTLLSHDPHYIAHEYLNQHWAAFECAEVMKMFAGIGLTYTARLPAHHNHWQLMAHQSFADHFTGIDAATAELRKDIHKNTMFRWDVFSRQPREAWLPHERGERTPDLFFRVAANASLPHVAQFGQIKVGIADSPHEELLAVMGEQSWTLTELLEAPGLAAFSPETITEAVDFAVALSLLRVEGGSVAADAAANASRIAGGQLTVPLAYNQQLLAKATLSGKKTAFASPLTRSGHTLGDLHVLLLDELLQRGREGLELRLATRLQATGKHLRHHATGSVLEHVAEMAAALEEIVLSFLETELPELCRVGIVVAQSP
jgi:SAM-dependent methyltransferase